MCRAACEGPPGLFYVDRGGVCGGLPRSPAASGRIPSSHASARTHTRASHVRARSGGPWQLADADLRHAAEAHRALTKDTRWSSAAQHCCCSCPAGLLLLLFEDKALLPCPGTEELCSLPTKKATCSPLPFKRAAPARVLREHKACSRRDVLGIRSPSLLERKRVGIRGAKANLATLGTNCSGWPLGG